MHVNGVDNKVADCLSHYYEHNTSENNHSENTYINTDIRLDPDGKLLLTDCYMELHAAATRQSKCLAKWQESHHIEAEILNASDKQSLPSEDTSSTDDVTTIAAGNDGKSLQTHIEETMDLRAIIKNAYCKDTICAKILHNQKPTQDSASGKGWFGQKISSSMMWSASCGMHFREGRGWSK